MDIISIFQLNYSTQMSISQLQNGYSFNAQKKILTNCSTEPMTTMI